MSEKQDINALAEFEKILNIIPDHIKNDVDFDVDIINRIYQEGLDEGKRQAMC